MSNLSPRQLSVLDSIETKPVLQPLFFKKAKGVVWFDELEKRDYFNPNNNPRPVPAEEEGFINIPRWQIIDYLVSTSYELKNPQNEDYAKKFLDLMRNVTIYSKEHSYSNHITWYHFAKVIRNIPPHLIDLQDFDWIDYWLDDPYETSLVATEIGEYWLPELLSRSFENQEQIALRLLDTLYKVVINDKKYGGYEEKEAVFRFHSWNAMEITKKVSRLSGTVLGLSALSIFESRLVTVLDSLNNDKWSFIWRPAIEEHDQNHGSNGADDILLVAYRDCCLGFAEQHDTEASEYFQSLLEKQYITLKRVAIYTADNYFDKLKSLIDSLLSTEFFQSQFRHEQWNLLKNHYSDFTEPQKAKILEIIEGIEYIDENNKVDKGTTAYERSIWLKAIKKLDGKALELYNKYVDIIGTEPEHPDFASYMTMGFARPESPIPRENLLLLDLDGLVKTINSYEDPGHLGEPGLDGLIQCFKSVVKERAEEFFPHLPKFADIKLRFIQSLIESYRDLWNEKKELPWNDIWPDLLEFCSEFVSKKDVLTKDSELEREVYIDDIRFIINEICQLIEDGVRSDEHAFDKSLIPKAYQILDLIINRQRGDKFESDDNAVNISINSPLGHSIEAFINLTLRSCRLADKDKSGHTEEWLIYEPTYEAGLKRSNEGEYEFVTLTSYYLPNFLYMSRDWTLSRLSKIFDQSNTRKWLCAMQGYAYVTNLYDNIYDHLKEKGDFLKVLKDENISESIRETVLKHAVIFYITGHEKIGDTDSLISIILERKKYEELRYIIWYIWTLRDRNIEKIQDAVYTLWPKFLDIIDFNNIDGKKLASQLCHWVSFIDAIDTDTKKWLLQIAPYSEVDYNSHDLLKGLARISDSQPSEVREVWLKMLETYSSAYPPDAIKQILRNLINLGVEGERMAVEIVGSYLEYGEEKPRIIFSEIKESIKATE